MNTFSQLNVTFHSITKSLLEDLCQNKIRATDIVNHIAILPLSLIKESYASTSPVADELEDKKTLAGLLSFLNACVWNFIDYHLLEYIIEGFGSKHLKQRMKEYVKDLEQFERNTTISELIKDWPKGKEKPPEFDKLTMKIDKSPHSCTLKELNDIRQNMCIKFWPRLSEYAQYIMYHYKHSEGCFIVTWIFPSDLALELKKFANKPSGHVFFVQNQILSFTLQGKQLYVNEKMATLGGKYYVCNRLPKPKVLILVI